MKGERLDVKVRLALLYYLLRRLDLDDFEETKRSAREQHVILANKEEVHHALRRAQAPTLADPDAAIVARAG
jgi:hypothetical protein